MGLHKHPVLSLRWTTLLTVAAVGPACKRSIEQHGKQARVRPTAGGRSPDAARVSLQFCLQFPYARRNFVGPRSL